MEQAAAGTTYEGDLSAAGHRYVVVISRFNSFITDRLAAGAVDALVRHGADAAQIDRVLSPGAYEIPLIAQRLARSGRYDAIICLGAVIRGGTPHFDYVASEVSKGIASVSLDSGVPVTFGILTTNSLEQAIDRAGAKMGNKGAEAALAAVEMINLLGGLPEGH